MVVYSVCINVCAKKGVSLHLIGTCPTFFIKNAKDKLIALFNTARYLWHTILLYL